MACSCKLSPANQVEGLPDGLKPRFLAGLTPNEVTKFLGDAKHKLFPAGAQIIDEGEMAKRLIMLSSGRGRHFVITKEGRKILLHWMTAGQVVGGVTMLSCPARYLTSVEVLERCEALVWDKPTIRAWAIRCPSLVQNMLGIAVMEHMAWLVSMHISLVEDDARERVAHLLMSLACAIGKPAAGGSIEVEITNEDLAAGANVTRYTVSRVLNEWQRTGALKKDRGKVVLRKPKLLTA